PMGWYPARQEGPEEKVIWRLVPGDPSNRVGREGPLTPGEMFLFEFEMGIGGAPNAGSVLARGTAIFSAASLGAAPGGPAQAVPEPGTLCLLGIGLGPLLLLPKRRLLPR